MLKRAVIAPRCELRRCAEMKALRDDAMVPSPRVRRCWASTASMKSALWRHSKIGRRKDGDEKVVLQAMRQRMSAVQQRLAKLTSTALDNGVDGCALCFSRRKERLAQRERARVTPRKTLRLRQRLRRLRARRRKARDATERAMLRVIRQCDGRRSTRSWDMKMSLMRRCAEAMVGHER